ncbi:MAG: acetyl-CoA hydrolase/transferase family protein [Porticoccaceae bacterium]
MTQWIDADAVATLLRPGMTVFVSGGISEPRDIGKALKQQPQASAGVNYIGAVFPGSRPTDFATMHTDSRLTTFFVTHGLRDLFAEDRINFLPLQYRAIYDYLEREASIDLALIQLTPPNAQGQCSHGLRIDFTPAILAKAKIVVAEINTAMPALAGCPTVPFAAVDYAVPVNRPLPNEAPGETNAEARAIGAHIASLVKDGDCIETGVGAIPDAALAAFRDKNDLGVHSGMIAHGVARLAQAGVITGAAKTIDRGKIVTGFVAGDTDTFAWARSATDLLLRPVNYTHDNAVLAQIDNFVAINSALEVDLFGQINAEMIGGRQISATGGGVDFIRGAARSKGGRSVIALSATAAGGKISRIVPTLAAGTVATALRSDADIFVTEFGIVRVRHLSVEARAQALIDIAAPQYRDELRAAWRARQRNG